MKGHIAASLAVLAKGRFVPVDVNKWLDDHAIKTPGIQGIDDTGATAVVEKK